MQRGGHIKHTGVDAPHHGLEDGPADVGDGDGGGLLLLVVAVKHGAEGVGGGQQRDAVRVELAPLHHEGHIRQRGVVHVLLAQVHLRRWRRRRAVDRRRCICLLRQLEQRACRRCALRKTMSDKCNMYTEHQNKCVNYPCAPCCCRKRVTLSR